MKHVHLNKRTHLVIRTIAFIGIGVSGFFIALQTGGLFKVGTTIFALISIALGLGSFSEVAETDD